MKIIRPIQTSDFPALKRIAIESGVGFTSLPVDDKLLEGKISRAVTSFAKSVEKPNSELYLFVMEDLETGDIVGTGGIEATVGLSDAFYSYHYGTVVHSSRELNVHNEVNTLTLCNDYTGMSEICTLFLRQVARGGNNGRFLSRFRFLFMAEHRQRFTDKVFAEMRGVSDTKGSSPFWKWLEEHFFSLDFPTVDYLTGVGKKEFIAELMPKNPIYVNLLSKEAQAVIGKVHKNTEPALRLLQLEGFMFAGYVDIFDAGPSVEANLESIRTVAMSSRLPVLIADQVADVEPEFMAINTELQGFRAAIIAATIVESEEIIKINQETARALAVNNGDHIRVAPLLP